MKAFTICSVRNFLLFYRYGHLNCYLEATISYTVNIVILLALKKLIKYKNISNLLCTGTYTYEQKKVAYQKMVS